MPSLDAIQALRTDRTSTGRPLSQREREEVVKPYLPAPRTDNVQSKPNRRGSSATSKRSAKRLASISSKPAGKWHKRRIRPFLALILYKLVFIITQLIFSVYIKSRQLYHTVFDYSLSILYYHHRTPDLIRQDVKGLSRVPQHLSVILDLKNGDDDEAIEEALTRLMSDVADISAWCTCAGIPMLSVYERSGILKTHIPSLHRAVLNAFRGYYPPDSLPALQIRAPHHSAYSPPASPTSSAAAEQTPKLNLLLLSATDGRETLVDLTKTLTEMAQRNKIQPSDISVDLIDAEVTESSCGDPDLLVLMAPSAYKSAKLAKKGRRGDANVNDSLSPSIGAEADAYEILGAGGDVCLRGYPPWQARLTEIFHVQDSDGVSYQVFLRALYQYAKAQMRFGR